jgi:hypothetical protein
VAEALPKIQTADEVVNRLQDAWLRVLNPFLRRAGIELVSVLPEASAAWVGRVVVLVQPGTPSRACVCVPNSSGGREWLSFAQSS